MYGRVIKISTQHRQWRSRLRAHVVSSARETCGLTEDLPLLYVDAMIEVIEGGLMFEEEEIESLLREPIRDCYMNPLVNIYLKLGKRSLPDRPLTSQVGIEQQPRRSYRLSLEKRLTLMEFVFVYSDAYSTDHLLRESFDPPANEIDWLALWQRWKARYPEWQSRTPKDLQKEWWRLTRSPSTEPTRREFFARQQLFWEPVFCQIGERGLDLLQEYWGTIDATPSSILEGDAITRGLFLKMKDGHDRTIERLEMIQAILRMNRERAQMPTTTQHLLESREAEDSANDR